MLVSWRTCQILLAAVVLVSCTDNLDPVAPAGGPATLDRDDRDHGPRGKWALETADQYLYVDHLLTDKTEDFAVSLRFMPLSQGTGELVTNLGASGSGWDFVLLGSEWGTLAGHLAFIDPATGVVAANAPAVVGVGEWHDASGGRRDGHWFITLDHHHYDLGATNAPTPIEPGSDRDYGYSYLMGAFDGLVDYVALRDLTTGRTIERFSMEEGQGDITVGQNGSKIGLFQNLWIPTHDAHDDNGGRDGRAITSCGTVITTKGNYTVTRDLIECPGAGIQVNASDVTIRLNGHIIDGQGAFSRSTNGIGIGTGVSGGVKRVKVLGPGYVREFFGGLTAEQVADSRVSGVTIERNAFGVPLNAGFGAGEPTHYSHDNMFEGNHVAFNIGHGFTLNGGATNLIANNNIHDNGGMGVLLYAGGSNTVRDNQLISNQVGVKVETNPDSHGHLITRNTSLRSWGGPDMVDNWGDCTHDTWRQNVFGTANLACIH